MDKLSAVRIGFRFPAASDNMESLPHVNHQQYYREHEHSHHGSYTIPVSSNMIRHRQWCPIPNIPGPYGVPWHHGYHNWYPREIHGGYYAGAAFWTEQSCERYPYHNQQYLAPSQLHPCNPCTDQAQRRVSSPMHTFPYFQDTYDRSMSSDGNYNFKGTVRIDAVPYMDIVSNCTSQEVRYGHISEGRRFNIMDGHRNYLPLQGDTDDARSDRMPHKRPDRSFQPAIAMEIDKPSQGLFPRYQRKEETIDYSPDVNKKMSESNTSGFRRHDFVAQNEPKMVVEETLNSDKESHAYLEMEETSFVKQTTKKCFSCAELPWNRWAKALPLGRRPLWSDVRNLSTTTLDLYISFFIKDYPVFVPNQDSQQLSQFIVKSLEEMETYLVEECQRSECHFLTDHQDKNFPLTRKALEDSNCIIKNHKSAETIVQNFERRGRPQTINVEHEKDLWNKGVLGIYEGSALLRTVHFYVSKCFGVRGPSKHKALRINHFRFGEDIESLYVSFQGDFNPKEHTSTNGQMAIKQYDDPENPRSFYKIMRTYIDALPMNDENALFYRNPYKKGKGQTTAGFSGVALSIQGLMA